MCRKGHESRCCVVDCKLLFCQQRAKLIEPEAQQNPDIATFPVLNTWLGPMEGIYPAFCGHLCQKRVLVQQASPHHFLDNICIAWMKPFFSICYSGQQLKRIIQHNSVKSDRGGKENIRAVSFICFLMTTCSIPPTDVVVKRRTSDHALNTAESFWVLTQVNNSRFCSGHRSWGEFSVSNWKCAQALCLKPRKLGAAWKQ